MQRTVAVGTGLSDVAGSGLWYYQRPSDNHISLGDVVSMNTPSPSLPHKVIGVVRHIGGVTDKDCRVKFLGLQLIEPKGDCDGAIKERSSGECVRYFRTDPRHALFVDVRQGVEKVSSSRLLQSLFQTTATLKMQKAECQHLERDKSILSDKVSELRSKLAAADYYIANLNVKVAVLQKQLLAVSCVEDFECVSETSRRLLLRKKEMEHTTTVIGREKSTLKKANSAPKRARVSLTPSMAPSLAPSLVPSMVPSMAPLSLRGITPIGRMAMAPPTPVYLCSGTPPRRHELSPFPTPVKFMHMPRPRSCPTPLPMPMQCVSHVLYGSTPMEMAVVSSTSSVSRSLTKGSPPPPPLFLAPATLGVDELMRLSAESRSGASDSEYYSDTDTTDDDDDDDYESDDESSEDDSKEHQCESQTSAKLRSKIGLDGISGSEQRAAEMDRDSVFDDEYLTSEGDDTRKMSEELSITSGSHECANGVQRRVRMSLSLPPIVESPMRDPMPGGTPHGHRKMIRRGKKAGTQTRGCLLSPH